jgi:hypothetical protein
LFDPPDLSLPSSKDYRREPSTPSLHTFLSEQNVISMPSTSMALAEFHWTVTSVHNSLSFCSPPTYISETN